MVGMSPGPPDYHNPLCYTNEIVINLRQLITSYSEMALSQLLSKPALSYRVPVSPSAVVSSL